MEKSWLRCTTCASYYPDQQYLQMHQRWKHRSKKQRMKSSNPKPGYPRKCDFCEEELATKLQMSRHVSADHRKEASKTWGLCRTCKGYFEGQSWYSVG